MATQGYGGGRYSPPANPKKKTPVAPMGIRQGTPPRPAPTTAPPLTPATYGYQGQGMAAGQDPTGFDAFLLRMFPHLARGGRR